MRKKSKIILSVQILFGIIFSILTFLLAARFYNKYYCVKNHYPRNFVQVELIAEDEKEEAYLYDRGKAVYERTYVVESIRYKTEISAKEFEDTFYVCKENPREVFSEYDIEKNDNQMFFSIILIGIGIIVIIVEIVIVIFGFHRIKNI